jgi:hypothetical protein
LWLATARFMYISGEFCINGRTLKWEFPMRS